LARKQLEELLGSNDQRIRLQAARSLYSFGSQPAPTPDEAEPPGPPPTLADGSRVTSLGDVLELARELQVGIPVLDELEHENTRLKAELAQLRSSS
jgi:hypothetical protein